MKFKKNIIIISVVTALIAMVSIRLVANKNGYEEELKMVSESNSVISVIVDTVRNQQVASEFSVNGTFTPSHEIAITAESQGKLQTINSEVGKNVVAGQVLASINNVVFASQLKFAKSNLEKSEKDMKRYDDLSHGDAATVQQYESAKQDFEAAQSAYTSAKVDYENTFIKAPFSGIITKRYVDKGSYLTTGSSVFDIVSIDKIKFVAKLTTEEVQGVAKDQVVTVQVDAYPESVFEGKISTITVQSDASKRYDVEIEVSNSSDKIVKPGMFGSAKFSNSSDSKNLIIPRQAIAGSIKNSEIFIVKGDSVISQKIVAKSLNDKYVAVTQGLQEGDVIVLSGQISLVNGSKIKLNK